MKKILSHSYNDITCKENLLLAWREFIVGKKSKPDVQRFELSLADNILSLHEDLANKTYSHGKYRSFYVNDPKRRHIHKASVRDRLLHHAVYRILYPFFDRIFIPDSFSCRLNKGTHKAINRFRDMSYKASYNHTKTCWVLKCDIKKFFANIDHEVLLKILKEYIPDENIIWLLENIISSFPLSETRPPIVETGLPLGNLTSQLFANVYMNKLDQFAKHKLKARYYIRYADDFVFLSQDKYLLENLIPRIQYFLKKELKLSLHPDKVFIKTYASGMDFLGWVNFCGFRILRKKTKKRMLNRIIANPKEEVLQSYLGLLGHGNAKKARDELLARYWLNREI